MKPARNVHVFHIHEEAFVKESFTLQRTDTQEHEASRQEWHIHYLVIAGMLQLKPVVSSGYQHRRQEEAAEEVKRRGQEFCKALHRAVQEEHLRHHLCYGFILFHQAPQGWYDFCAKPYIGVDDKVVLTTHLYCLAQGNVVSASITFIILLDEFQPEAPTLVLEENIILALVLIQLTFQTQIIIAMIYDPYRLNRRNEQASEYSLQVQKVIIVCYY